MNSDAGQVFYHRNAQNEVIHIDVFHSEGRIKPEDVARSIVDAVSRTNLETIDGIPGPSLIPFLPYIDIQTAVGGGRVDGPLLYGREAGVRQAHVTHVHLAILNVHVLVSSIFVIVGSVEAAIQNAGLELRKISYVAAESGSAPMDLGDYRTLTDSLLKQSGRDPLTNTTPALSWYRAEALARQAAQVIATGTPGPLQAPSAGCIDSSWFRVPRPETGEIRQALMKSDLIQLTVTNTAAPRGNGPGCLGAIVEIEPQAAAVVAACCQHTCA